MPLSKVPPRPTRFSLFHLDLDGFKEVNDRLGHEAGDVLLRLVAARLRQASREADIIARPGGDEFIIIAPGMTPSIGEAFAARLVTEICRDPFSLGGGRSASVGVSVGFACAPEDGTAFEELYRKADAALYAVKSQGKRSWRRSLAAVA